MKDEITELKTSNSNYNLRFYFNLEKLHESSINGEQLWACGKLDLQNKQTGEIKTKGGDHFVLRDFFGKITPLDNSAEAARWAAKNGNSDIASYIVGD